jgi:hypothetical protein
LETDEHFSLATWELTIMILRILGTMMGKELAFKGVLNKFLWSAINLILDAFRVTTSTSLTYAGVKEAAPHT